MLLFIIASVAVHGIVRKKAQLWWGITGLVLILLGLSMEYTARNVMSEFQQEFQDQSPEEMGRAMGEFLKGLESGSK